MRMLDLLVKRTHDLGKPKKLQSRLGEKFRPSPEDQLTIIQGLKMTLSKKIYSKTIRPKTISQTWSRCRQLTLTLRS